MKKRNCIIAAWAAACCVTPATVLADSESTFDNIWSYAVLAGDRKAGEYPFVKLRGRYQGQYYNLDADSDGESDDTETRRLRAGLDIRFTPAVRLSFDLNLNSDGSEPFVDNFDFLALDVQVAPKTKVSLGKLRRKPLTLEDSTSSNEILTVERSLAANTVAVGNSGGVYVAHTTGDWKLGFGVLSGGLSDDLELPDADGGQMVQVNAGRALGKNSTMRIDYLFNDGDADNAVAAPYRHTMSFNTASSWGGLNLQTDLILAETDTTDSDYLLGAVLLPSFDLTQQLKAVARYTYLASSNSDGVRLQKRYERAADTLASDRGKTYHALYAGLNYYIYGDKLKFMLGVEQAWLDRQVGNYSALTGLSALRFYF